LSSTTYRDAGLVNGAKYYYMVTAVSSFGTSAYSNKASVTPAVPLPPIPETPYALAASASGTNIQLSWTPIPGDVSYNVLRTTTSGSGYTVVAQRVPTAAYQDTGLRIGIRYFYVVQAVNAGGTSNNSGEAAATPLPQGTEINDTASNFVYTGTTWTYGSGRGSGDYNSDVHFASRVGDSATFKFTGTGVSLITETNNNEGNMTVQIDGGPPVTVNCFSDALHPLQAIYSNLSLANGNHTLTVTMASGSYMLIDAAIVY
jgi:hypothetical protein